MAPGAHARKHGFDGVVGRCGVAWSGAQRGKLGAVVFLAQAVLEAVLSVAVWAAHAGILQGVDEGFAGDMVALLRVVDVGLFRRSAVFLLVGAVSAAGPFPCAGASVGGF